MTDHDFRRAFNEHKDAVFALALRLTGLAEVAEDAAQDCFVQLLRDPGKFDPARVDTQVDVNFWLVKSSCP